MAKIFKYREFIKLVQEINSFKKELHRLLAEENLTHLKSVEEFIIDDKIKSSIEKLFAASETIFEIEVLVVDSDNIDWVANSELLTEWERYKKIPKTNLTYRYDAGMGVAGMEDHIHVYLGNSKNQVYAINRPGTFHDGTYAKLSSREIKFLKSIGFTPPKDGLLEWIVLPTGGNYIGYKRQLLIS